VIRRMSGLSRASFGWFCLALALGMSMHGCVKQDEPEWLVGPTWAPTPIPSAEPTASPTPPTPPTAKPTEPCKQLVIKMRRDVDGEFLFDSTRVLNSGPVVNALVVTHKEEVVLNATYPTFFSEEVPHSDESCTNSSLWNTQDGFCKFVNDTNTANVWSVLAISMKSGIGSLAANKRTALINAYDMEDTTTFQNGDLFAMTTYKELTGSWKRVKQRKEQANYDLEDETVCNDIL
jgi:hypothetical protein